MNDRLAAIQVGPLAQLVEQETLNLLVDGFESVGGPPI